MMRRSGARLHALLREEAYTLLGAKTTDSLAVIKIKYLLLCRKKHPEICGDARTFYLFSKAYATVLRDHGVVGKYGEFEYLPREPRNFGEEVVLPPDPAIPLVEAQRAVDDETWQRRVLEAAKAEQSLLSGDDEESQYAQLVATSGSPPPPLAALETVSNDNSNNCSIQEITAATTTTAVVGAPSPLTNQAAMLLAESRIGISRDGAVVDLSRPVPADMEPYTCPITKKQIVPLHDGLGDDEVEMNETFRPRWKPLSPESRRIMDVLENRQDVVGECSRTSTEIMNNVKEKHTLLIEFSIMNCVLFSCVVFVASSAFQYRKYLQSIESTPAAMKEHISADTMLPWWGNDVEYERQVKRLFLEEWQKARQTARRVQTFQDGVAREELKEDRRAQLDREVFVVTSEKLKKLRINAATEKADKEAMLNAAPKVLPPIRTEATEQKRRELLEAYKAAAAEAGGMDKLLAPSSAVKKNASAA